MITPSKNVFLTVPMSHGVRPLYKEIPYSSPCSVYESLISSNSFLLESVRGSQKIARYSFIGIDPCLSCRIKNGAIEMYSSEKRSTMFSKEPLSVLKGLINKYKQIPIDDLPPFQGGIVGFFGYDFVHYLERLPKTAVDDLALPDAHFLLFDKVVAFDHKDKRCWIVACPGVKDSLNENSKIIRGWSEKYDESAEALNDILRRILDFASPGKDSSRRSDSMMRVSGRKIDIVCETGQEAYMDMVIRAKEYIAAGDIFQINLSQRVSAQVLHKNPWDLYSVLKSVNPSPFAAYMDFGDYHIVSSSPERLLRVSGRTVDTRPIAGTRPRGSDSREDQMMREELLLNEKERAEHIMLIDLERNDLGRISEYGTVNVDELMITEDCSHVIHIVSNVTGNLADGKDCFDAIRAAFPGGTITGVPKVRCMEIIDELEPVSRGPYTGSIGYIGFAGGMDFNIIIRTFVIKKDMAYVQAGAGIVADSDPEREYFETLKKAEALIKTLMLI
jgi:anthranilate/para-aminobenzoate synthase component I